jgi:hypothetical protein
LNASDHGHNGKTFNQITSKIQKNVSSQSEIQNNNLFRALPLKIYRREINVGTDSSFNRCNPRTSSSIDLINMPNGSIINSSTQNENGLVNILDNVLPNSSCEEPGTCFKFTSPSENAKRRCRSSGMIKRQFDISRDTTSYYTNSNQYLVSRNRTFQQNQYYHIREGNASVKPGDALSSQNIYSANGISHCPKHYIPQDTSFQYIWVNTIIDSVTYTGDVSENIFTVNLPAGHYAIEDIANVFNYTMLTNYHYLVQGSNQAPEFLLYLAYNPSYKKIELHSIPTSTSIYSPGSYTLPIDPSKPKTKIPKYIETWANPDEATAAQFKISNNLFSSVIGFSATTFPDASSNSTEQFRLGDTYTPIQPTFVQVVYKPSNPQFATQGGVTSSSLIARKKYDAVTNNAVVYKKAYGIAVANALAYGVSENGYTIKDKIGFPLRQTPKFSKYSGEMECQKCNTWNPRTGTKAN